MPSHPEKPTPLTEGAFIYSLPSLDGTVRLTAQLGFEPLSDHMVEVRAVAVIKLYDSVSLDVIHQETQPLSEQAASGRGPTDEEMDYWDDLLVRYASDM